MVVAHISEEWIVVVVTIALIHEVVIAGWVVLAHVNGMVIVNMSGYCTCTWYSDCICKS